MVKRSTNKSECKRGQRDKMRKGKKYLADSTDDSRVF
jgi:hypothetical protein